jgi:hypothetical protein
LNHKSRVSYLTQQWGFETANRTTEIEHLESTATMIGPHG